LEEEMKKAVIEPGSQILWPEREVAANAKMIALQLQSKAWNQEITEKLSDCLGEELASETPHRGSRTKPFAYLSQHCEILDECSDSYYIDHKIFSLLTSLRDKSKKSKKLRAALKEAAKEVSEKLNRFKTIVDFGLEPSPEEREEFIAFFNQIHDGIHKYFIEQPVRNPAVRH
jgi:hypothetical protein